MLEQALANFMLRKASEVKKDLYSITTKERRNGLKIKILKEQRKEINRGALIFYNSVYQLHL